MSNCQETNFVYKFNNKSSPANYIVQSKRLLFTRIDEYKNKKNISVVRAGQLNFKHAFDWQNTIVFLNGSIFDTLFLNLTENARFQK